MARIVLWLIPLWLAAAPVEGLVRTTISFDSDWRFLKADAPGAEKPGFADAQWRALNVPHDWSIEGPFDEKNPTGGAGGFLPAGIGWYRKHFTLSADYAQRRVFVEFDGVMANSEVWINGFRLGKRPYGYVSFRYELTGHVTFGAKNANVLAVRADNSGQPASRWYAGAGIYRHVRLLVIAPVHLDQWATFVTTPHVAAGEGTVRVQTSVVNQSDAARTVTLEVAILGPDGKTVKTAETAPQAVAAGKSADFEQEIAVQSPDIWNLDHPVLYRAVASVRAGKTTLDDEVVHFGIREFHFDAATGFWLNGRNFKLKGVCLHHDGGAVGAAVPLRVWERRLEQLKKLGVNAIRTAHNPPAPEFLDLCDRMGFLVMDEMFDCWTVAKNPYDYHLYFRDWSLTDTRDTVLRDRNHPSIVVYSAGNEIRDTPNAELANGILKGLVDAFHKADPTRPVSQALFRPNVSHDYENGLADLLDVIGQNYRENEILAAHAAKPTRKILGTENQHGREVWLALRDNPPYSGQFLWSGIDYIGESRLWPGVIAGSGLLDHTGAVKPVGYERQSWWSDQPMVHIVRRVAPRQGPGGTPPTDPGYEPAARPQMQTLFSDWTPAGAAAHAENVEVYSNCEEVELVLNGKSLGSKPHAADDAPRVWNVPFEPGIIKATGKNKGKIVATHELRTAGKPARIMLAADRDQLAPDWDDVVYVTASVVDDNGLLVPGADQLVTFRTTGPGVIAAVDSADNASHEPFQASARHAFQGQCLAIIKASGAGRIAVTASSPGLAAATVNIGAGEFRAGDYGAKGDGKTVDTAAIQKAIDEAAKAGGTVVFAPGVYLSGSLFLKSGTELRVDAGVEIRGVQDLAAYPIMQTRVAGVEMKWPAALINVYEQSHVKISGKGVIDGDGKIWWDKYWALRKEYEPKGLRWASDYDCQRPRLIVIYKSSDVELQGLELRRSGFWTVHICYSQRVHVDGTTIRNNIGGKGPSTDGIDIDSSSNVLVERCDIEGNDDDICLKAGRDADGLRVNRPTEKIVIRDCTVRGGAAGITIGSETSGGIRDVEAYRIHVLRPVPNGILFKSASTRGGTIENISIHDMDMEGVSTPISITLNWNPSYSYAKMPEGIQNPPDYWRVLTEAVPSEKGLPHFRNVKISDIKAVDAQRAFSVVSYQDSPLENFEFKNLDIEAKSAGSIQYADHWTFVNTRIKTADGSVVALKNCGSVTGLAEK